MIRCCGVAGLIHKWGCVVAICVFGDSGEDAGEEGEG